jgi:protein involved in polysaccharide export with SLBB domain
MRFLAMIFLCFIIALPAHAQYDELLGLSTEQVVTPNGPTPEEIQAQPKENPDDQEISAPPADVKKQVEGLMPYGSQLFQGQLAQDKPSGLNPNYQIAAGDQINVSIWGPTTFSQILTVDQQGNIFIPDVGPVSVGGVRVSELNERVEQQVRRIYTSNVKVYTNLGGTQPVSIFVTGNVTSPGRYSGVSTYTILHYISLAGGIDPVRGSFREIELIRGGKTLETFDIYAFLNEGVAPKSQLKDGDTILVKPQLTSIAAEGSVKSHYRFEFTKSIITGDDLINLSTPFPDVTNVSVSGTRNGNPFLDYVDLKTFKTMRIFDGDNVTFLQGKIGELINVRIEGQHQGPREMVVPLGTKLVDVLDYVPVDKNLSNTDAVRLKRRSVALQQKKSLSESLDRLERKALSRTPLNAADAAQKAQEVAYLTRFISRIRLIEPEGRVVVSTKDGFENVLLENDDEIIVPAATALVMVNGEVYDPKAVVYKKGKDKEYYINKAGGFSDFADEKGILVFKANGESIPFEKTNVEAGDEIIVLPKFKLNKLQVAKEMLDVLSKATIAVALPISIAND